MNKHIKYMAGALASVAAASPAMAQGVTEGWQASVTGYVWVSGFEGTTSVQPEGNTSSTDANFGDLMDNLSGFFVGKGEIQYKRFGLYGDVLYLGLEAERVSDPSNPLNIGAEVEFDTTTATVAAFYRAIENENTNFDVLAGVRLNDVKIALDIQGPGPGVERELSRSFTTPIVGARWTQRTSQRTSVTGYGDYGSNDESTVWQLYGTLNWAWTENAILSGGYRYYQLEFEQPRMNADITLSGPLVAITYKF